MLYRKNMLLPIMGGMGYGTNLANNGGWLSQKGEK